MKKYLFIGAHTDDIELAAAGWISQLLKAGQEVQCMTFSYVGRMELLYEHTNAMNALGVKKWRCAHYDNRIMNYHRQSILDDLLVYLNDYLPDIVVTHDPNDYHQDHACVGQESIRAFKAHSSIITYRMPWNGRNEPNYFVPLTFEDVQNKIQVLQHYQSQSSRHYMADYRITSILRNSRWPHYDYVEEFQIIQLFGNDHQ